MRLRVLGQGLDQFAVGLQLAVGFTCVSRFALLSLGAAAAGMAAECLWTKG